MNTVTITDATKRISHAVVNVLFKQKFPSGRHRSFSTGIYGVQVHLAPGG